MKNTLKINLQFRGFSDIHKVKLLLEYCNFKISKI